MVYRSSVDLCDSAGWNAVIRRKVSQWPITLHAEVAIQKQITNKFIKIYFIGPRTAPLGFKELANKKYKCTGVWIFFFCVLASSFVAIHGVHPLDYINIP